MPKIIKMLMQVKCTKDMRMFCLETGRSILVPAGTVLDRWTNDEKKIWYTYHKNGQNYERNLGISYFLIKGKYRKFKKMKLFKGE